jgi:hypothetical protein
MNQSQDKLVNGAVGIEAPLGAIAHTARHLSQTYTGDSLKLLALLRLLESLHQEIRDTLFQDSLPDTRQALYSLLRDIETSGGWPYIHRMRLQDLLQKLTQDLEGTDQCVNQEHQPTP